MSMIFNLYFFCSVLQNLKMNAVEDFMSLFLDDAVVNINEVVFLGIQNISKINNECLEIVENIENDYFPNQYDSSKGYFETIISTYLEEDYIKTFKMPKATLQKLVAHLATKISNVGKMIVPFEKKVYLTIYMLTSKVTFKSAGDIFGLQTSTVNSIFREICYLIAQCRYDFIKWPSGNSQELTKIRIQAVYNFPNCIGFLDTHSIHVKMPKYNQKNILLQAVCDDKMKFLDVSIGHMANNSDMQIFQDSLLYKHLEHLMDVNTYLLGDNAYPLMMNVMTPYRNSGKLTNNQRKYNKIHSKARRCTRKAIISLLSKFKRLNNFKVNKINDVSVIICAACVLHNFIIINEEPCEEIYIISESELNKQFSTPSVKRNLLCDYINNNSLTT